MSEPYVLMAMLVVMMQMMFMGRPAFIMSLVVIVEAYQNNETIVSKKLEIFNYEKNYFIRWNTLDFKEIVAQFNFSCP